MPDSTPPVSIQTTAGFSYSRRNDGIHVFRFVDNRRETVDAWSKTLLELERETLRNHEHIRCMYYIQRIWLTPYVIKTAIRTARLGSDYIKSSSAILVADRFGSALFQTLLRQLPVQALQARQIFTNEDDAVKWLDERLRLLEHITIVEPGQD